MVEYHVIRFPWNDNLYAVRLADDGTIAEAKYVSEDEASQIVGDENAIRKRLLQLGRPNVASGLQWHFSRHRTRVTPRDCIVPPQS